MSPSASSVAADRDVFHFTVPLSAEEFLTLAGIGPSASVGRTPWRSSGWALVDADGGVWGWHPVDADAADWCDAPAALAGFIIEPRTRARLVGDGFHVVADEGGALLNTLLRSQPWHRLPPLPSGPTRRPSQPILPHWGELLDAALTAVSQHGGPPAVGVAVEDLIRAPGGHLHRPAIFDQTVMRRWLASDDGHAAIAAMRAAAGGAKSPSTYAEALGLLDPRGCTGRPGAQHIIDAHLSDGDWSIGTCRSCWHPVLMHESSDSAEPSTVWAIFGDLR